MIPTAAFRKWTLALITSSMVALFTIASCQEKSAPPPIPPTKADAASILNGLPMRSVGPASMGGRIVDIEGLDSNPDTLYVAAATGGLWKTTDGGATWASLFDNYSTLCMGDVAVSQSNPNIVWVGTGEPNPRNSVSWGDGVYKSTDAGKTWDFMGLKNTRHIGRIVIHPTNPNIVYVAALGDFWGSNPDRGIYKTADGGKIWTLSKFIDDETGFVDIAIDPSEPDILYAAAYRVRRDEFATGTPIVETGPDAGLYRTDDAGTTWTKMTNGLPNRPLGRCGVAIYRQNTNIVYAVIQTDRTPNIPAGQPASGRAAATGRAGAGGGGGGGRGGGGAGGRGGPVSDGTDISIGGIFRSDDKGKTWKKVNDLVPRPFYYGQIRIDPKNDQRIYVLGTEFALSNDGGKTFVLGARAEGGDLGVVEEVDGDEDLNLDKDADKVMDQLLNKDLDKDLDKLLDPDLDKDRQFPAPQESQVQPATGPATQPATQPGRGGRGGGGGGQGGGQVHPDNHALWIDPTNPNRLFLGNDGGLWLSTNHATTWRANRGIVIGQFYGVAVSMHTPYRIGGGLQDNGTWVGPSQNRSTEGVTITEWRSYVGGDGFEVAFDPKVPDTFYGESQGGNINRVNLASTGRGSQPIQPGARRGGGGGRGGAATGPGSRPATTQAATTEPGTAAATEPATTVAAGGGGGATAVGEGAAPAGGGAGGRGRGPANRFNWDTPLMVSNHDSNTIYIGAHTLFKSTDRGGNWTTISPDLTRGNPTGAYGGTDGGGVHSLTSIAESPLSADILWTGSDDGAVRVTRDGGKTWTDVSDKIPTPPARWINRVETSSTAQGTAFVAIDRHRQSDLKPYLFKTTDFGATWTSLANDLPPEAPVHVIRESSHNPSLLFVGTENGLFGSLDGGKHWSPIANGMPPAVPVYDLVIHPRERELVIGTHGRSIWIMDVAPLEQLDFSVLSSRAYLYDIKPANITPTTRPTTQPAANSFKAPNPPPGAVIHYYLGEFNHAVWLTITDAAGNQVASLPASSNAGLHTITWDPRKSGLSANTLANLQVHLRVGNETLTKPLSIKIED